MLTEKLNKVLIKILFLILVFNLNSCVLFQTSEKSDILLPSETETPGWRLGSSIKEFTKENLREYADEAEYSLLNDYGFKELFTARYTNISNGSIQLTVEIYEMNSNINAFGVYSMKRTEEALETNICGDSYSSGLSLYALKENYFIKIKSESNYPDYNNDMNDFQKIICDKIKSGKSLPVYLSLFEKFEKKKSLVYRVNGYFDLPILKNIFTRKIDISGKNRFIFFTKRDSAHNSISEFSGILNNKSLNFILSGTGNSQTALVKIRDNKFIYISVFKEWIFGTFDAENMPEGEKIISFLFSELKQYLADNK